MIKVIKELKIWFSILLRIQELHKCLSRSETLSAGKEKKKRRGPKGPNPLSCKKKKKNRHVAPPPPSEQQMNEDRKRRKRRSKKRSAADNFSSPVAV